MAVNLSFITHEEDSSTIINRRYVEKSNLAHDVPPEKSPPPSSFRFSFKRWSIDNGAVTKENDSLDLDHSSTLPSFKDLALTERLKEANLLSFVKRKRSSRRKHKSLSVEREELKFSNSSESESELCGDNDSTSDSQTIAKDDSLSPILQSSVDFKAVERRSSYLRLRRKSTPHLSSTIAEDSEFVINTPRQLSVDCGQLSSSLQSKKTGAADLTHSRRKKRSDSLILSGIPFFNLSKSREKNSKSVDDLSRSVELSREIKRSVSLAPKSSEFGTDKSSYKKLAFSKENSNENEIDFQVSSFSSQNPNKNTEDEKEPNWQKQRKSSKVRKKLSLPSIWRSDMMTNYPYDVSFQDDSSHEPGSADIDSSKYPRMKSFDEVVFDVLRVSPEAYARQLTLLDWSHFSAIIPDEITSCGWTKKDKWKRSPNVCAMTQRFNHTSFWVIREILHASTTKTRVETLILFIKIAKKVFELNNLHSLMAIVQSLNTSSIIRLTKTWALIPKNYRAAFERLLTLVKEDGNRTELRSHMEDIRLPCIPFLGMYLSDVMYIDTAHPDTGGLENQERANKLNNILRVLSEFQQSKYDHLHDEPHIKNYLTSVKYIEELQKFLEEENYKLSLKIEPVQTSATTNGHHRFELSAERPDTSLCRHVSHTPPSQGKFVPSHRKTKSLGREIAFNGTVSFRNKPENSRIPKRQSWYNSKSKQRDSTVWYISPVKGFSSENINDSGSLKRGTSPVRDVAITTSLLDDSIIATPSSRTSNRNAVTSSNNGSLGSSRSNSGSEFSEHEDLPSSSNRTLDISSSDFHTCTFEGYLKRKCVLKQGKKPSMSSWSKYWVCICGSKLVYYEPKSFRGSNREDFRARPHKVVSILGWMLLYSNDPSRLEYFQLNNPDSGNMYRFQTESKEVALVWIANLEEAIKGHPQPEHDLINLEDS